MSVKGVGDVKLDDEEVDRIERAQLALLLHITPETVDRMPAQDAADVLAIQAANKDIEAWQMSKRRK